MKQKLTMRGYGLFFASLFFLEWKAISAENLSALNGKSPSMILMLLFLLVSIKKIRRISLSKWEFIAIVTLLLELLRGLISAEFIGNYDGLSRFINGYVGIIIFYMGIKVCYPQFYNPTFRIKFWNIIYNGCLYLTVLMGGLQILYILTGSRSLYAVIDKMTFRGLTYLDAGKVQLFTEPSLFGEILFVVFAPAAYYVLKNRIHKKNRVLLATFVMFVINLLGVSVRFIVDLIVFLMVCCVSVLYAGKGDSKVKTVLFVIVIAFFAYGILYFNWFGLAERNHAIERLHNIITASDFTSLDGSGSIRLEYLRCAWKGFLQKPIFGWGTGNYVGALNANAHRIGNVMADAELVAACQQRDMVSFSFVLTQMCENGLIGLIHVLNVYYLLIKMIKKTNPILMNTVSLFIMYMFIQNEMLGCFSIAMVLALYNFNDFPVNRYGNCENGLIRVGNQL